MSDKFVTVDLKQSLTGLNGKPMKETSEKDSKNLSLGKCIASMLNALTNFEKSEAIKLFREIDSYYNEEPLEADIDKLEWMIKKLEGVEHYTPYALGQVLSILEDYKDKLKKKQEKASSKPAKKEDEQKEE